MRQASRELLKQSPAIEAYKRLAKTDGSQWMPAKPWLPCFGIRFRLDALWSGSFLHDHAHRAISPNSFPAITSRPDHAQRRLDMSLSIQAIRALPGSSCTRFSRANSRALLCDTRVPVCGTIMTAACLAFI
jgi:hypothetical protein